MLLVWEKLFLAHLPADPLHTIEPLGSALAFIGLATLAAPAAVVGVWGAIRGHWVWQ